MRMYRRGQDNYFQSNVLWLCDSSKESNLLIGILFIEVIMLEFLFICLLVIVCVPAFFILVLLSCIVTGSCVDPDDNGLLKSKEQKEVWRQEKLKKLGLL